ncbi:Filamin/ABP280 repeat protein [Opisthorchis viverrini]|uniref:Filamin/ABP280 repeat protein n=1 Tax=Opisthorchis viverrini TaxID=6198 RepID=A0A1S8X6I5_OPIVI|nr:Filamin/ABP280 repeat protein [Opisthorchis viverrini]
MPEPPIKNFTTDWNSGVAIGALVDSCAPGLCPDWCKWDPRHCLKNATEAMTMAEEWLNVPQLIRPEEMINPRVDEKAMMTYISQFPSAHLKEGAPLRPKLDPGRVRAYGAGLEHKGNRINQPCRFNVDTAEAGSGQLEIILLNPKGVRIPCEVVPDKNASYSCTYQPTMEGEHRVIIRYAGQEIRGSPFSVSVEPPIGDPLKVIISGPGIQPTGGNSVGRRSYFTVDTKRAGMGTVECFVVDPHGRRDSVEPRITQPEGEGVFLVEYTPRDVGRHQIFINFGGQKLPNSPYVVTVGPPAAVAALSAIVTMVEQVPKSSSNGEKTKHDITVVTPPISRLLSDRLHSPLALVSTDVLHAEQLNGPSEQTEKLQHSSKDLTKSNGTVQCNGQHTAVENGHNVSQDTNHMNVYLAVDLHAVYLRGQGILPCFDRLPCSSMTSSSSDFLLVGAESPVGNGIHDSSSLCHGETFCATGQNVENASNPDHVALPDSEFMESVWQLREDKPREFNPEFAYATGRGVRPRGIRAQDKVEFQIHTERCGNQASLLATLIRQNGETEQVAVEQLDKDTWNCSYIPRRPGKYCLRVLYGGVDIQNSPFEIIVGPHKTSAIKATGPGLVAGVVNHPIIFSVSCREQSSKIGFSIEGPSEARMDCFNHGDGTARVTYWVTQPGEYAVHILYEDEDIPGSPYMPNILPDSSDVFADRVRVYGPVIEMAKTKFALGKPVEMYIDGLKEALSTVAQRTLADQKLDSVLHIECHDALGTSVPVRYVRRADGSIVYSFTPTTPGTYTIFATVLNIPLKGSPYRVNVAPEVRPENVKIWGPGLKECVQNEPSWFLLNPIEAFPGVDTTDALQSNPVTVHATDNFGRPVQVDLSRQADGVYRIEYCPPPNVSDIYFTPMLGSIPVSKSPLHVMVRPAFDTSSIRIIGLEQTVPINTEQQFNVLTCRPASSYVVSLLSVEDPLVSLPCKVTETTDGLLVTFKARESGVFQASIFSGGQTITDPVTFTVINSQRVHVSIFANDKSDIPEGTNGFDLRPSETELPTTVGVVSKEIMKPRFISFDSRYMKAFCLTESDVPPSEKNFVAEVSWDCSLLKKANFNDCLRPAEETSASICNTHTSPDQCTKSNEPPSNASGESSLDGFAVMASLTKPGKDDPPVRKLFNVRITGRSETDCQDESLFSENVDIHQIMTYTVLTDPVMQQLEHQSSTTQLIDGSALAKGESDDTTGSDGSSSNFGRYPPRPFITDIEKSCFTLAYRAFHSSLNHQTVLVAKSSWPQCLPDHPASTVTAAGSGLERAVATQISVFTIDSRSAPPAPLGVTVTGPSEAKIICIDNGDGTCDVSYNPPLPGRYTISVIYNGEAHISGSPFFVQAYPVGKIDLSTDEIRTHGVGVEADGVYKASYVKFTVDASEIDKVGEGVISAILTAPDGERLACQTTNNNDGTYTCSYTPLEEGAHQIDVSYEGVQVPGSPFNIRVIPGCDPNRVKVYGKGLENGPHLCPGESAEFTVDLTGAGQGGLGLAVEGPSEAPIRCRDNRDGTCTVFYTPKEPGQYSIFVRFNDTNVPNSPFYVDVKTKVDPSQVQCYGPGLESGLLRAGWPAYFTVDTKKAGDAKLQVRYTPKPGGETRPAHIQPLGAAAGKDISQPQHYHKITYTPEAEGLCHIEVLYDGEHVPGSPFLVQIRKSCEPERVRVLGPGVDGPVLASLPVTFTVDARDAGMGDLTLGLTDPRGQSVPVRVVPLPVDNESIVTNGAVPSVTSLASGDVSDTGLLSCTYEPYLVGPHNIHVMFAGVEVDNSPFVIQSVPTGRADLCSIEDPISEIVPIETENVIRVNIAQGGTGRLTCQVVQPATKPGVSATLLPVESEENSDGIVSVYYTPKQLGELCVELRFGGQLIPGGEFTQKVVTREEAAKPAKATSQFRSVEFRLPAPRGDADVECMVVRPSGTHQHVTPTINPDDTITIMYDPVEQGMHELHVNGITRAKPGDIRSSTVAMPLQGSPYRFFVDFVTTGHVTAYGPGLSHGVTNQPAEFTINTKDAGGGGLSLSVEGPSKAEIKCDEHDDGTCTVRYYPSAPGDYQVAIKFKDQHISGSPFPAKIIGDTYTRAQLNLGATSDIALEAFGDDISTLTANVQSVSGREEPCVLKRLPNNRLGISFTPREIGEHLISVYQAGEHITNSPFRIRISEKEIGDPRRVRVTGPGLISGVANQPNHFTVDTRDAGYAGLSLSIEGPSKAEIDCQDNHDGTCSVMYLPTEPGMYIINVKYADVHVPNSPFTVDVGGKSLSRVTERITRRREASTVTTVGSRCELSLRVADTTLRDMTASVTAPSGDTYPCEIVQVDADHYNIKFVPQEMGEHLVSVKHRGINIAGSPFQFTVGPITDGVAHKVRATGPNLQRGFTNAINEFTIYTREAGAGTLAIAIEGPSRAGIDCVERADGSSVVSYQVSLPGTYHCSIKFNDVHIPYSPFAIQIADSGRTGRVASYAVPSQVSGLQETAPVGSEEFPSQIGRPVAFTVHHQLVGGQVLRARVQAPSGLIEEAGIQQVDRDQFVVRFVPMESGPHFVYVHIVPVEMNDMNVELGPGSPYPPLEGSPFRLVISHQPADPSMVHANGEGLRRGRVGEKNTFFVHTANAGSGVLNVTVDGPSKVTLTTQEQDEGYSFSYVPTAPGSYEISIKYGGNHHINGSPFKAEITGSIRSPTVLNSRVADRTSNVVLETIEKSIVDYQASRVSQNLRDNQADRVRCEGMGLKRADIQGVNYFTVDASDAGTEILLVGICGPTRPFEEVKVNHLGNNRYSVSYRVNEKGRHWLLVKWGDHHVPGSPFTVDVP